MGNNGVAFAAIISAGICAWIGELAHTVVFAAFFVGLMRPATKIHVDSHFHLHPDDDDSLFPTDTNLTTPEALRRESVSMLPK